LDGKPFLLVAALGAFASYGDAPCERDFRDTTAAERQTMLGVMQAAKAALPDAPTGWIIGGYEELSSIGSICMDGENTPWSYDCSRTFNRADRLRWLSRTLGPGAYQRPRRSNGTFCTPYDCQSR
jgi:hypothetical protein